MENGYHKQRSRSRSPRPSRGVRGKDRHRSPPRGPRNHDRQDRDKKRSSRSRSRSPPRGPRNDRNRDSVRQRSPPKGPRGIKREADDGYDRMDHDHRDARHAAARYPREYDDRKRVKIKQEPKVNIMDIDPEGEDDETFRARMREAMGFGMFRTTKDTKVPGNDKLYAVRKEKKTEYRQYMNRQGGFNRPLSPTR